MCTFCGINVHAPTIVVRGTFTINVVEPVDPCDINKDSEVTMEDLLALTDGWLSHSGDSNYNTDADLNIPKDLVIDFLDLSILLNCYTAVP